MAPVDVLTFKSAKGPTEAVLEEVDDLLEEHRGFLERILKEKQHLEGEDYKRWRRIMRTA